MSASSHPKINRMPRAAKYSQIRVAANRNPGKSTARGVHSNGSGANRSESEKQPLKPRNVSENTEVEHDAAALFTAIAKRKAEAEIKDMEAASDDSGSEQLSTVSSGDEQAGAKPAIESKDEVVSPVSSKTSLSTNFRNVDIINMLRTINDKVDNIAKRPEKCVILAAQANAKIDRLTSCSELLQSSNTSGKIAELKLVPVNSLADLEAAEDLCVDEDYVENVIRQMGQMYGNNRFKHKGGTVCHQMIDYFVDRRFLRLCSWTGISKTLDENQELVPKIAFSRYDKFINLFYKVIYNADDTFTKDECDTFLKLCIRNSKQRANEQMLRQPASRNRSKKLRDDSCSSNDYNRKTTSPVQNSKSNPECKGIIEQGQGESIKMEYTGQITVNEHDAYEDLEELIIEETDLRGTVN